MAQQLIVTILGTDKVGILSIIAAAVSESGCNILDSRQAVYGQDFSLTMILEGQKTAITRAEIKIPALCQEHDLLSMSKRTRQHSKQNLEQLAEASFTGIDTLGVMSKIIAFFADQQVSVSAFRQKTFSEESEEWVKCNMMINLPTQADCQQLNDAFQVLLAENQLTGKISLNH